MGQYKPLQVAIVGCGNISRAYGGSVNRNNAKELIALDDVDGFLIGGASLDANHFYDIYKFIEENI